MLGDHSLRTPSPLLYPLHLCLAGIFAFVLPFICWGALATPGHPHGLPHFVFFAPQSTADAATHQHEDAQGDQTVIANPDGTDDAPVAQSVAPILGVALLAPILLLLAMLLAPMLRHIARRLHEPSYSSLESPPATPPPRHLIALFA